MTTLGEDGELFMEPTSCCLPCRYVTEYQKFLEDLSTGSYVENSVDSVLLDIDGKRLMCEALYLLGVMLLFMDLKVTTLSHKVSVSPRFCSYLLDVCCLPLQVCLPVTSQCPVVVFCATGARPRP